MKTASTENAREIIEEDAMRELPYSSKLSSIWILLFFTLHAPLAVLLKANPSVATVHALGTLLVGLLALGKEGQPNMVIYVAAYIVGAEALWRLGRAEVFWEYGKYAVSLLFIFSLLKGKRLARSDKKSILYFLFLLPSILLLPEFDRREISFNLSGPLALAVSCSFFSTVKLEKLQLSKMLIAFIAPIIGAAYLSTTGTLMYDEITFRASSKITSAGFGANQMSDILGLGAFLAVVLAVNCREKRIFSGLMALIALWLISQCALTYSRGGFWSALGAIIVAIFYLAHDKLMRRYFIILGIIFFILLKLVVMPWLNDFTKGTLVERFESFDSTGRKEIAIDDWIIFMKNPLLGIGPGQAEHSRTLERSRGHGAHTEFTRLLSEHGILGLFAFAILIWIVIGRLRLNLNPREKAICLSFTVWAIITMLHSSMRLAAIPIFFGLGSAYIILEKNNILAPR